MKIYYALLLMLLLILTACAPNKALELKQKLESPPPVQAEPNFRSAYLYSMGSVAFERGEFDAADALFRLALGFDPLSDNIRKRIFETSVARMADGLIAPALAAALSDSLILEMEFDETMLNQAFWIYSQVEDHEGLDFVIEELCTRYPSARSYIMRYIFDLSFKNKNNFGVLDQALALAQNDLLSLKQIARIYTEVNPKKAVDVMQAMRKQFPSLEVDEILIRLLFGLGDFKSARRLFTSYKYPEDELYMAQYIDLALSESLYDEIIFHQKSILRTQHRILVQRLAATASLANNPKLVAEIRKKLETWEPNPNLDSEIYAILVVEQLYQNKLTDTTDYSPKFFTAPDVDSIVLLSVLRYYDLVKKPKPELSAEFIADFEPRLSRLADPLLREYLTNYVLAAAGALDEEIYRESKSELVKGILARDMGTEEDYGFLLQFYYRENNDAERLELLERAIMKFPDRGIFRNDLGYTYLMMGKDLGRAYELITSAVNLEPENPHYLDSMAWYYYLTGNPKKALENMRIPLQMEEMPAEISYHIGLIYKELGEEAKARTYLLQTIETDDGFADLAAEELQLLKEPKPHDAKDAQHIIDIKD